MTGEANDFHARSLLAVFAHPDDESLASGGLLALCARRGARVSLLCLTRGEHGPGGHGSSASTMAHTRTQELEAAARVLGLAEATLAHFPDGMLPWIGEGVVEGEVRRALTRVRPNVVITFGEDGLYWHPDHVAVHEAVTTAVRGCDADSRPALYYVTMPPGQMRAVADTLAARAPDNARPALFGIENPDAFGADARAPTLVVDVRECARVKLAALRCHATQMEGGWLDPLTDDDARVLLGTEHYRRADVGNAARAFIEDLGAPPEARA